MVRHDSFRLEASKTVYFDPWKLAPGSPKADIILVSHEHHDHFSLEDIKLISSKDTVIVCDKAVDRQLRGKVVCREIKILACADAVEIDGIKVKAVSSYNIGKAFHTKESGKLGYLVTIDGGNPVSCRGYGFYPGDERIFLRYRPLPVSGTYVMTADEAAEAALAIKPKIAIPMHWGILWAL